MLLASKHLRRDKGPLRSGNPLHRDGLSVMLLGDNRCRDPSGVFGTGYVHSDPRSARHYALQPALRIAHCLDAIEAAAALVPQMDNPSVSAVRQRDDLVVPVCEADSDPDLRPHLGGAVVVDLGHFGTDDLLHASLVSVADAHTSYGREARDAGEGHRDDGVLHNGLLSQVVGNFSPSS
jgi:hypothetical protein